MSYTPTAEGISEFNDFCGMAADKYKATLAGRFDPLQVKKDLLTLKVFHGFDISWKTAAESRADAAKLERELSPRQMKPYFRGRPAIAPAKRDRLIEAVHVMMREGHATPFACRVSGVKYATYITWRGKLGITEPALGAQGSAKNKKSNQTI